MFTNKLFVFLGLTVLGAVNAQSSTSSSGVSLPTSGISPCILQCVSTTATENGCSSFADFACVCTNTAFQDASRQCLQANCTQDDLTAALGLQQSQCAAFNTGSGGASSTGSGSSSNTQPPSPSNTSPGSSGNNSPSSSSGSPPPSNTNNGALPAMLISSAGTVLTMVVGLTGIAIGGGLIL